MGKAMAFDFASACHEAVQESLNEIYFFDAETFQFVQANKGALLNLGSTLAELLKLTPIDIKPELTNKAFNKLLEPLKTGIKKKIQFETVHKRRDGSLYPVLVNLQLSTVQPHQLFLAIILDITEQKLLEESLVNSQKLHDEAQAIAHLGHWKLDLVDNTLFWSNEIYRIFGLELGIECGYETFTKTVHPDDRDLVTLAYSDSVENKTSYSIDHRVLMNDGEVKWVHEEGRTIYGKDDIPLESIGTVLDITHSKRAEESLKNSLEDIIQVVALAVETRDPYTAGHERRVGDIAVAIAREMGLENNILRAFDGVASSMT